MRPLELIRKKRGLTHKEFNMSNDFLAESKSKSYTPKKLKQKFLQKLNSKILVNYQHPLLNFVKFLTLKVNLNIFLLSIFISLLCLHEHTLAYLQTSCCSGQKNCKGSNYPFIRSTKILFLNKFFSAFWIKMVLCQLNFCKY